MSSHPFLDVAVNLGCVVAGFLTSARVRWGAYQPSGRFFVALATFTTFALWFITGVALHVNFWLLGNDLSYEKTTRFAYLALVPLACGIYLCITKQAAAPPETDTPAESNSK